MNIFGETFPPEILDQIENRQKVYGSGYQREDGLGNNSRSSEQITYLNSKTAWCKLISGVDIDNIAALNNPTIQSLGLGADILARQFVLFNGTADYTSRGLREGIDYTNSLNGDFTKAYGIGGTEFGIRPMMGITSAEITHENRGSLRRAQVKIKAFNRTQFEIIDVLYLRLGFSVLLEWGHSMIINNDGNIDTNPVGLSLSDEFLDGECRYADFLKLIYDQRLANGGNYDAMFAKVSNFSWSFLPDGSYDITVNLVSIGDVIESLKVNVLTDSPNQNNSIPGSRQDTGPTKIDTDVFKDDVVGDIIDAFAHSHTIGNFLYMTKKLIDGYGLANASMGVHTLSLNPTDTSLFNKLKNEIDSDSNLIKFDLTSFHTDIDDLMVVRFDDLGSGLLTYNDRYYIRLGSFLDFLKEYIVPYIYSKNNDFYHLLDIDTDTDTNLMNVERLQVSVEPRICYVNRVIPLFFNSTVSNYVFGAQNSKSPFINSTITNAVNKCYYGNIMNIYLEHTFILKTIESLKDDKGNLSLISFLQGLMKGLNEGLGGINDFDVFIDETSNMIKIIDKNPLNNVEQVCNAINANFSSSFYFNNNKPLNTIDPSKIGYGDLLVYGYWPQYVSKEYLNPNTDELFIVKKKQPRAGFIKTFGLTSEIPPSFSTMITAGAAAQGSVVGENDTALSKLNKGLLDRFKTALNNDIYNNPPASQADYDNKKTEYDRMLYDYVQFFYRLSHGPETDTEYPVSDEKDIDTFKGTFSSLMEKSIALNKAKDLLNKTDTQENYLNTGFIPFNLSLTMDGLSGIKINQQFNMDTSYLPSNYPNTMRFLIKNLSHRIQDNKWETKLETYCVPKAITDLVSLRTPSSVNTAPPESGGVSTSPTTQTQLYRGQTRSNYSDTVQFLTWVLHGIGIPNPNQSQIQFMKVWRQKESGKAAWNPLNTTWKKPNSKSYNRNIDPNTGIDHPVQNYANRSDGLNATVSTLMGSNYINLRQDIKNIRTDADINNVLKTLTNSPWGTRFSTFDYTKFVPLTDFMYTDPIIPK